MIGLCYGWLTLWLTYVMAGLCYGWLMLCRTKFSNVCGSLSAGLWTKPLLFWFHKNRFFSAWHHKYSIKTSQDAPSNSLFCNVLSCRQSFSGAPVIAKKSKSKYMGSCSLLRFIARGTTFCKFAWRRYLVNVRCFCTSWNCRGVLGKVHKVS